MLLHRVCDQSLCLSISSVACTPLRYVTTAAPLLVAAACGLDERVEGACHVWYNPYNVKYSVLPISVFSHFRNQRRWVVVLHPSVVFQVF